MPAPADVILTTPKPVEEKKQEVGFQIIEDIESATAMVKDLSAQPAIGLKCEGNAVAADGRVSVIALSTPQKVYLLDIIAFKHRKFGPESAMETTEALFEDSGLKDFLSNDTTIKVLHDCRIDSTALYHQFGAKLTTVFDTSMAAYLKQIDSGIAQPKLAVPLGELLATHCGVKGFNAKQLEQTKANKTHPKSWSTRPLDAKLRDYIVEETSHLLQLYQALNSSLSAHSKAKMAVLNHSQINALLPNHAKTAPPKDPKTNPNLDKTVMKAMQELTLSSKKILTGK